MKKENLMLKNSRQLPKLEFLIFAMVFLLLSAVFVSAATPDLEVSKIDKGSVVIKELENPAVYDFVIKNKGPADSFQIFTLLSITMTPNGYFEIPAGESKTEIVSYVNRELLQKFSDYFRFEYYLQNKNGDVFKDNLILKLVSLKDAIEINPNPINPSDNKVSIIVKNLENANIENLKINFSSNFFEKTTKEISLKPNEQTEIEILIDQEKIKKMTAGQYMIKSVLHGKEKNIETESIINYLEKTGTSVEQKTEGWIIRKTTIKKTNEGNVPTTANIEVEKNILSRLFTINNPEPAITNRKGLFVTYEWEKSLGPNESMSVEITTNYTIPFIIVILLVISGLLAKMYSQTAITINKRVSLVKTSSGQFALKIKLSLKAKKYVSNIQIIDTLPGMTKLYEKFGKTPDKIEKNRIFWNIEKLSAGEERVYSYIIYSNLNVIGRFELPAATAVFDKDGKTEEVWSNRAFFAAETSNSELKKKE